MREDLTCWIKLIFLTTFLATVRPVKLKEDILSCTFAELSFGLCQFIQEVRRPNGEKYDPDSILYLCLGIQQVTQTIRVLLGTYRTCPGYLCFIFVVPCSCLFFVEEARMYHFCALFLS